MGLNDRPPPPPPLSQGLDPALVLTSDLRFHIVVACLQKALSRLFPINLQIPLRMYMILK